MKNRAKYQFIIGCAKRESIYFLFALLGILFSFNKLQAQSFHHIESYVGLSGIEGNNGVAIADYDQDGDLDMFVVARAMDIDEDSNSHSRLFSNNNDGTFTDMTEASGMLNLYPYNSQISVSSAFQGFKYGAYWGDYDNDGYPDLFMTHLYKVQLFHNEGDGTFKDVTVEAGVVAPGCANTDATWFDYNNDGFLDIYISEWETTCRGNRMYRNNGDGTFSNVGNIFSGDTTNNRSYQSIPYDFNNDGWLDLYVANDGYKNDLFINNGGVGFVESANQFGLDHSKSDMGMALGDYNNDGFFDLFITAIRDNVLYENKGDNTFVDKSKTFGLDNADWAWGTVFSDFDLDRDEDLYVVNGFYTDYQNRYFENLLNQNEIGFIDSSKKTGLGELTESVSAGIFDYDNDGDLDIFLANNDRPSYFYENIITDFANPNEGLHWSKIKLEGTVSNRDAVGTIIYIKTSSGSLHRYFNGKGFLSQNLVPVHFGLSIDTEIQELKISWPSGIIDTYYNLPADKLIKVKEGENFEIIDQTPSIKTYGCTDPNSCNYNPNAMVSTGTCAYLQTGNIIGKANALKNSIEIYSYQLKEGNTLEWQVTGGQIVNIQQDNAIVVHWDTGDTGKVSLVESNGKCKSKTLELIVFLTDEPVVVKEQSVARKWNETLLSLIRKDYARPTVHARNLFHTAVAMYDAWALYEDMASPYLIGNKVHGFKSDFDGFSTTEQINEARNKSISYAAYRLLSERFSQSPNPSLSKSIIDATMVEFGYDTSYISEDYTNGDARALGNYIATQVIAYGLQDGSNEGNQYQNQYYEPVNSPLVLNNPEINDITSINPDRWQPLSFNTFIDQSGHLIEGVTPDFLGPEWGNVQPFSLDEDAKTTYSRDGHNYNVYYDPGAPPSVASEDYKWAFTLVSKWGSHLNPHDGVLWDISPKSIGNISTTQFPKSYSEYKNFYKEFEGGDIGTGRDINPVTKAPYQEQMVPRGDYARVLAEFWADGPDSETPPGHWFTILNYVNDHELLRKQMNGKGNILFDLEWDVKSYFIMGGAMHDAAIAAWSIKGWYDYIRPISAIRYMCSKGQCSDTSQTNYDPLGIHLTEGFVELVEMGDPLAGENNEHVGKIKLYSWKGHDFINDPEVDEAGVGWILAENWWPYQRPTFVTPPFAGYVSGHSTYSRAAAEVMTLLTGDEYFPGGMGEFLAKKNEFLVFEEGPSVDVTLQWATYRDASDQCSLSRIWGGIHPPADDINGRLIGEKIGQKAFVFGTKYFEGLKDEAVIVEGNMKVYPNPILTSSELFVTHTTKTSHFSIYDINGRLINIPMVHFDEDKEISTLQLPQSLSRGIYILKINNKSRKIIVSGK